LPSIAGGLAGFSTKSVISPAAFTAITLKPVASARGTSMQTRALGAFADVIDEHVRVVHFVDVIAGKHDDEIGLMRLNPNPRLRAGRLFPRRGGRSAT
jgi:hypothetical protein